MVANFILQKDLKIANALNDCCISSLNRARLELSQDRLDEAERWVKEFQRCKKDLDKLIEKKKQHDMLLDLTKHLKEHGLDIEKII